MGVFFVALVYEREVVTDTCTTEYGATLFSLADYLALRSGIKGQGGDIVTGKGMKK